MNERKLQYFVMGIGAVLAGMALLADPLGVSGAGFSRGQVLLMLLGILVILGGLAGRKLPQYYQGAGLMLLNTLVLLMIIEIAAGVYATFTQNADSNSAQVIITEKWQIDYYNRQPWTEDFLREFNQASVRYEPFTLWRHREQTGALINVAEDGSRPVPDTNCSADAYQIMTFGGSAMWGWGAPDWGTIPAYLQVELETDRPLCIQNYAEIGYVSTQELLSLINQLQQGNIPDLVIFYTGNNDTVIGYRTGSATSHQDYLKIRDSLQGSDQASGGLTLDDLAGYSYALNLIDDAVDNLAAQQPEQLSDKLVDLTPEQYPAVVAVLAAHYDANYRTVAALAESYGFDYAFFLQPTIVLTEKTMTEEEASRQLDPEYQDGLPVFMPMTYDAILALDHEHIYDLRGAVDGMEQQVWVDLSHITPEGNAVVAAQMADILNPLIED